MSQKRSKMAKKRQKWCFLILVVDAIFFT